MNVRGLLSTRGRKVGAAIGGMVLTGIGALVVDAVRSGADKVVEAVRDRGDLVVRVVPHGEFSASHVYAPYYVVPSSVWADPQAVPAADRRDDRLLAAMRARGVSASPGIVRLELRGRTDEPVVVNDLRIEVVRRASPVRGWFTADPGCGSAPVRLAEVDLDRSPPRTTFVDENNKPLRNLSLRVARTDVEEIELQAKTTGDVTWRVRIFYSGPKGRGSVLVDDDGRPFRVTAVTASKGYRKEFAANGGSSLVREPAWDTGVQAC